MHALWPAAPVYRPAAHSPHAELPLPPWNAPALQSLHTVCCARSWNLPTVQLWHADAPRPLEARVPFGQIEQALAPAEPCALPGSQAVHAVAEALFW